MTLTYSRQASVSSECTALLSLIIAERRLSESNVLIDTTNKAIAKTRKFHVSSSCFASDIYHPMKRNNLLVQTHRHVFDQHSGRVRCFGR